MLLNTKMRYKFIFVILSSNQLSESNVYYSNNDKYSLLKKWNKLYFDSFIEEIKFFYVEFNETIKNDISVIEDFIYIKGSELPLVPNLLVKTKSAIDYINSNYEYEYIIHTNLTSIWNIPTLLKLYQEIPRVMFFGGHLIFKSFISGTGIIISHDLIPVLLNINPFQYSENNDVAISQFMKCKNIPIYNLEFSPKYKLNYQILDETCNDVSSPHHKNNNTAIAEIDIDNVLYFRVKNASIENDLYITKQLINKMYNITIM